MQLDEFDWNQTQKAVEAYYIDKMHSVAIQVRNILNLTAIALFLYALLCFLLVYIFRIFNFPAWIFALIAFFFMEFASLRSKALFKKVKKKEQIVDELLEILHSETTLAEKEAFMDIIVALRADDNARIIEALEKDPPSSALSKLGFIKTLKTDFNISHSH